MPLHTIPVTIPYRLTDDQAGILYPVQVDAVATEPRAALATAYVLVQALARVQHGGRPVALMPERAQIGAPGAAVPGPYAYVLSNGHLIAHLPLPSRFEGASAMVLEQTFKGLPDGLFGVVVDCAPLQYINSQSMAALAAHAGRVNLRLFRVPDHIAKVLGMVGLDRIVRCLPSLQGALEDLKPAPPA
jgi:anti-anti-sigma regulatory factor